MKYYLYNSKANNGIRPEFPQGVEPVDAVGLDYPKFFSELKNDDEVVLVGGDGTVNYFVNALDTDKIKNNVYLYGAGTGNDFLNDIGGQPGVEVLLNPYIKNLPTVFVNGIEKKFINGIGYGIDGYCCEVADQIKEKTPNAKIDYTGIAIKGLLFHFKPHDAKIIVDGELHEFNNTWIAASMKGRYYGGGMKITPEQDRNSGMLSAVCYHTGSKLAALINFPNIFKGTHVNNKKLTAIWTGKEIHVQFARPCALQIDGETVLGVTEYRVKA